jgi:sugar phosphate isomerase/epimerase
MASEIKDLSKLCVHTMTTKPWSLAEAAEGYTKAGVPAITVWRQALEPLGLKDSASLLKSSGLEVVSLCRGGFFPGETPTKRQDAIDDNLLAIEEAVEIGAPLIVLVCGAVPGQPLSESRKQIVEGIQAILPQVRDAGVKLAIEPLHPVYADDRSAVNTLGQANDMVELIGSKLVGIAADVYHLWWDPELEQQIRRAGSSIFAFHICDWRTPTRDILLDRGLMGEGCINIPQIRGWVEEAGFEGYNEVEIFSSEYWASDQETYLESIKLAYLARS